MRYQQPSQKITGTPDKDSAGKSPDKYQRFPQEALIKCSSSEMERIRSPPERLARKWPQA
jgi:hypothetical protein